MVLFEIGKFDPNARTRTIVLNSLVKHQSSTQAKKQQQNSLVPEAKCQSDVYQAGRLKLGVGTVPFNNAGSAPALAA